MSAATNHGRRVLLAGGGSGGHVFPALAVGDELAARGWQVDFAGAAAGMEARLVGERGLSFHPLPALPFVGRGLVDRLRALWTLVRSIFAARRLIRGLGIAVVVGTGGYVSAPAVLGAALAGRPSLLLEPNAVPGTANRWLSLWASDAAIAFDGCAGLLRCGAGVTGVPVRAEFAALPDEPARREPLRMLVAGGSQGAEQLNRLVPAALGRLAGSAAGSGPEVRVADFVADMAAELGAAHLVVSRAGAITAAEICNAGRASLLVPLTLAGGHQADNARALAEAGAAVVLPSAGLAAEPLADELGTLLADRGRLAAMGRAARSLARPDAAAAIAERVERLAGPPAAQEAA